MQKYTVNQVLISNLLTWVQTNAIAIPEIQRPFVWDSTKVRDLMDSLYNGYPIGYIISWKNPTAKLKDGSLSEGKKVLIDGQQRITALRAAILGEKIIDSDYTEKRIIISFNPVSETFATLTPAITNDSQWIPDISLVLKEQGGLFEAVRAYLGKNPEVPRELVENNINKLIQILNRQIGIIDLEADLDIDTVTEIFVRINSKGVVLSQADFVMSKIASYDEHDNFGSNLRKAIDYFSHLAKAPHFYKYIQENDKKFAQTKYFPKLAWLKNENDSLYDPDYADILRVAHTVEFERGKMSDLVGLLSGRNFETRKFEKEIMDESFERLSNAVMDLINETHFQRFVMIIKAAGFIDNSMINSQNALNMAYAVYLKLRQLGVDNNEIEKWVQKWFVMSLLTSRYSASAESVIEADIKGISSKGIEAVLREIEESQLAENFWSVTLVQDLDRSLINAPALQVFFASQAKNNIKGFLSKDITVANMIIHKGDVHHIFPKGYLKKKFSNRSEYNQVANYVYAQSEINIKIGSKAPNLYFKQLLDQCENGQPVYGRIVDKKELMENLEKHAIPLDIFDMTIDNYEEFLLKRRKLMATKIESYYKGLSGIAGKVLNGNNFMEMIENGENDDTEFKAGLGWYQPEDTGGYNMEYAVVKTIAAFLNSNGGKLFIGVNDAGEILGIQKDVEYSGKKNHDSYLVRLNTLITSKLGKDISQYIQLEILYLDSKYVCLVDVLGSAKPSYLKEGKEKKFYIRSSASTQPLDIEEANSYIKNNWK